MSLASMQRQGSNAYVGRALDTGRTEGEILAGLADRFPGETPDDLAAAFDQGLMGWQATKQFELNDPNFPVLPSQVPSAGTLRGSYRWWVYVVVRDPHTGREIETSMDVTTSALNDPAALLDAVQARVNQLYQGTESPLLRYKSFAEPAVMNFIPFMVQR